MKSIVFPILLAFLVAGGGASAQNLTGDWTGAIFFANLNAELETSFTIVQEGQKLEGHSTKNASKRILGGFKGGLVKIFAKKTFEKGALLHIRKGVVEGDSIKAVLATIFGSNYWFRGQILGDTLWKGVLLDGRLRPQGGFILRRGEFSPVADYGKITEHLFELTLEKIYKREACLEKPFPAFEKKFRSISRKLVDDADYFAAFYYLSQQKYSLPFTHYMLAKPASAAMKAEAPEKQAAPAPAPVKKEEDLSLTFLDDQTALITITSFAGHPVALIDSCFGVLKARNTPNCIIDLRNNTGGTISSMRIAEHLTDSILYGGFFLTNKWFASNKGLPDAGQYERLPELNESNLEKLWNGIHTMEGFKLKVVPLESRYHGKVFVLTSGRTASACEPLCYNLKYYRKAVLVGQQTSGAMLNGEKFRLEPGWQLEIPTADYYTIDGKRIDLVGVPPDHEVAKDAEIEFVLKELIK